jgi:phage terminase large subunit GpA-like protein
MNALAQGIRDGIKLAFDGTILDWASDHVSFPNSDRASRFDPSVAPWLNAPLLAASDDETTQVFLRAPTGGGKTTLMETLACFIVAQKPGPTLFVGQTDDMVKDWTESRLLPIFNECQPVKDLFPEDRHALRKTTILFPHMVLFAGGANMTNLQEKSMR